MPDSKLYQQALEFHSVATHVPPGPQLSLSVWTQGWIYGTWMPCRQRNASSTTCTGVGQILIISSIILANIQLILRRYSGTYKRSFDIHPSMLCHTGDRLCGYVHNPCAQYCRRTIIAHTLWTHGLRGAIVAASVALAIHVYNLCLVGPVVVSSYFGLFLSVRQLSMAAWVHCAQVWASTY